jgi:hypothetical protein
MTKCPTFMQAIDFIEVVKSSRAHHAFPRSQRFPTSAELAGLYARALSLQWRRRTFALVFGVLVSGHEIPFPGNRDFGSNLRPESDYARCPSARIDSIRLRSRQPSRNRNRTEAPVNFAAAVFVPLTRREHHFGHQQGRHNAATASRKEN